MSPGYLPFKDALDLPAFFCDNCGFWQRHFAEPTACPLCIDARHVLPQNGVAVPHARSGRRLYPCHWDEVEPGVWRFFNDPVERHRLVGLPDPARRTATSPSRVARSTAPRPSTCIADLGGVQVLAASHPHSYGAIWQLAGPLRSRTGAAPGRPRLVGRGLRQLAVRRAAGTDARVGAASHGRPFRRPHRAARRAPGRILFCGDALKFELDPADPRRAVTISAHKAFVRGIPLTPGELGATARCSRRSTSRQTWTPFEQAANSGRREALALIDSMLATRPHAYPVPLDRISSRHREAAAAVAIHTCSQRCMDRRALASADGSIVESTAPLRSAPCPPRQPAPQPSWPPNWNPSWLA